MSQQENYRAPETLTVREVKAGGKILVSTLCCGKQTPEAALKNLFKQS